jgi:DNA-binding transcriptional LysR family regulator
MNFTHLKAFYYVAKYKSYTVAAHELNISQPTLSLQVQNFEKYYDTPLLKRGKRHIELTEEGNLIFSYSKKIFSLASEVENKIEVMNTLLSGKLKIGSTPSLAHFVLPHIIFTLKKDRPDLEIQINTAVSKVVMAKVLDYENHIALLGRVSYPSNIVYKPFISTRLYFITTDAMKDKISLKDLANYPIILRGSGSATRDYVINEFRERNIPLNNRIACEDASAIKNMVRLGIGGAFFPQFSIEKNVNNNNLRCIEILEDLLVHIDVIYLREREDSKIIKEFLSALNKYGTSD